MPILVSTILFTVLSPFGSDDEDDTQPIDTTARTSTSRTVVVSEAPPDGDETSPPQRDVQHPTPTASPRASSPKRARVESSKEPLLLAGSSTASSLDDVRICTVFLSNISTFVDFPFVSCVNPVELFLLY